ncbi:MAG: hypothetical protein EZS28_028902, partial [Streblomastix strix]
YGWGGAIFIQTSVATENLNELNFLMRDLVFVGCSAVNSIGNNIHIQSANTSATGEAIKTENLLTVKDITDLYTNKLYGSDYMGIDQSKVNDDNTPISFHEPLFINPPSRIFLNPYVVNAFNGIVNVFCGESDIPSYNGGGIFASIYTGGKLTIDGQCNFTECKSDYGGGFLAHVAGRNSLLTLEDGIQFESCTSRYLNGGGAYLDISDQATSLREGGGMNVRIQNENSILELVGVLFENCSTFGSQCYGGGLYVVVNTNTSLLISGMSLFNNCSSDYIGGGCYVSCSGSGSQIQITGQLEFENCTSDLGGGLCFDIFDQATIDIDQMSFINCTASEGGGLNVYINNGDFSVTGPVIFQNCESQIGGGSSMIVQLYLEVKFTQICIEGTLIIKDTTFDNCTCTQPGNGGGIFATMQWENSILELIDLSFKNCHALDGYVYREDMGRGGGLFVCVFSGSQLIMSGTCIFKNCSAVNGGGIYMYIDSGWKVNIKDQCIFSECKTSQSGGGIYSYIYGIFNIEDTTFDSCSCIQPGNGGGISLYHGTSSILSIINSSFINCKTIQNSSNQRYGSGGAIFIQTSIIAENLNETNFLLTDLVFTGCSAVNSIGNNLHIQSIDTYATGEAIESENLLSVNGTTNLYYNNSYQQDYMGIDQSKSILKILRSILC